MVNRHRAYGRDGKVGSPPKREPAPWLDPSAVAAVSGIGRLLEVSLTFLSRRRLRPDPAGRLARRRAALAAGLERVVADAQRPPSVVSASAPLNREGIAHARDAILSLAAAVAQPDAHEDGMRLARWLLTDCGSPLYAPATPEQLTLAVWEAWVALGPESSSRGGPAGVGLLKSWPRASDEPVSARRPRGVRRGRSRGPPR
jgi:hypothetical protein